MSVRVAACLLVAVAAGPFAGEAIAATPAENAKFARQLGSYMKPTFERKAPELVLGKVTCVLLSKGALAHCLAYFTDAKANENVVYGIKATVAESGTVRWTTTTLTCTDAKTGKKLAC